MAVLSAQALDEMMTADPALAASLMALLARKLSLRLRRRQRPTQRRQADHTLDADDTQETLMERDQAIKFINDLLRLMVSRNGSDLFLTADFPPAIKVDGKVTKVSPQPLTGQHTLALARAVMNDKQAAEFERTKECNFAISPPGIGRFRVNAFMQQGKVGMVMRVDSGDAAHHRRRWACRRC